jgi:hypothetical protein
VKYVKDRNGVKSKSTFKYQFKLQKEGVNLLALSVLLTIREV